MKRVLLVAAAGVVALVLAAVILLWQSERRALIDTIAQHSEGLSQRLSSYANKLSNLPDAAERYGWWSAPLSTAPGMDARSDDWSTIAASDLGGALPQALSVYLGHRGARRFAYLHLPHSAVALDTRLALRLGSELTLTIPLDIPGPVSMALRPGGNLRGRIRHAGDGVHVELAWPRRLDNEGLNLAVDTDQRAKQQASAVLSAEHIAAPPASLSDSALYLLDKQGLVVRWHEAAAMSRQSATAWPLMPKAKQLPVLTLPRAAEPWLGLGEDDAWLRLDSGWALAATAPTEASQRWLAVRPMPGVPASGSRWLATILLMATISLCGLIIALWPRQWRQASTAIREADRHGDMTVDSQRLPPGSGNFHHELNALLHRQAQRQDYLSSLGARLSHELRTPLVASAGALENLSHSQSLRAEDQALVERARSGLARLQTMLGAMSEVRRLEDALQHAEFQEVDINAIIREWVAAMADLHPQPRLRAVTGSEPLMIFCAPELLINAMEKLLDNAWSFTPKAGWINVTVQPQGQWLELRVVNSGSQLPPGDPQTLFEPLRSQRSAEASGEPHLGQGLYIVRLVSELHQGRAGAQQQGETVAFSLYIPRRGGETAS